MALCGAEVQGGAGVPEQPRQAHQGAARRRGVVRGGMIGRCQAPLVKQREVPGDHPHTIATCAAGFLGVSSRRRRTWSIIPGFPQKEGVSNTAHGPARRQSSAPSHWAVPGSMWVALFINPAPVLCCW